MRTAKSFQLVLVTAPDLKTAQRLASGALQKRLVACANLIPGVQSHYRWRGKLESGKEVLMLLKTTRSQLGRLERWLLRHHPYETPEILALPLGAGTPRYLAWLRTSCKD